MRKLMHLNPVFNIYQRFLATEALNFVPKHVPVGEKDIRILEDFIFDSRRIFVLTGAGISTESGIPDYRSEGVGLYARTNHKPIQYQQFLKSATVRQRYWARNFVGWERFSACEPGASHKSLANLETGLGKVSVVVTQNVDHLHHKAGSRNVVELHGSAYRVVCLGCGRSYSRAEIQDALKLLNPTMNEVATMIRPDGDVEIPQEKIAEFKPPLCSCGGVLKPDMVFFGDNVPKDRVELVQSHVSKSDAVLVLGSSLTVLSSYRIILQAVEEGKRIAVVNIGPTRADDIITLKISAKCSDILTKIC